jgi:hypothetical protein
VRELSFRGASLNRFYACEARGVPFLLKLSLYRKTSPELYSAEVRAKVESGKILSEPDTEIAVLKLLKQAIIDKNISPCIIELVDVRTCTGVERVRPKDLVCEQLLGSANGDDTSGGVETLFCRYASMVQDGLAHDKWAFIVLEHCDMSLWEFLSRNVDTPITHEIIRAVLFMVIHAVAAIQARYSEFRHYDLHTGNVMLLIDHAYKFDARNVHYLRFGDGDKCCNVPYFGIIPKLIDFGTATIPEEGIESVAGQERDFMLKRQSGDITFLFHNIYIMVANMVSEDGGNPTLRLLEQLDPSRSYIKYYLPGKYKTSAQPPSAATMLKSAAFDSYREWVAPEHILKQYDQ